MLSPDGSSAQTTLTVPTLSTFSHTVNHHLTPTLPSHWSAQTHTGLSLVGGWSQLSTAWVVTTSLGGLSPEPEPSLTWSPSTIAWPVPQ